ncbi:glycosyl transferase [Aggregatibacter actinomycetemcomitans serotype e str. SC936]|uniref:glycosyltransferase family 9 protein n=1 Tax=Aggregatibacter actinomycetemcomitans TaxID=714 RepID=UPI00077E6362|nr:glycosyltransferase family 9 protein [Aggregatibacter actinomycetemcomitans]KYK75392.1 glycosyl transferase [Aggregatibacter actinomycetemcomitans serotype e str. SA3096]KYK81217.1 glycosyl transferase [Aggregatibacter actinomycetemcomitans serotype e str. SC936]KYK96812.1 glycosyl transferase [Aggregatibacter actinomycetemcomitans serotype e str. ANH9776]TYB20961.1 ADP-heptose--LPS heptosyltransferase I [Aggregatibacter actinomycetemcomitans]
MALFTQAPKSLCILRLSAIGDVCHALAAVQHIQCYWKDTKITWIIGKTEVQLLRNVTGIEFIVYDKKCGWRGVWNLWRQLKHRRFDALLNMQTAFRASILSLGIHADYRIGFGKWRAREGQWLFTNRQIQDPTNPHVLDGFMAFADELGVPPAPAQWDLPVTEADSAAVWQYLAPNRKNLLISPCSSKKEKDWLAERYAEVANIAHQHDVNVILCSSPAPRELAMIKEIKALCDFEPVDTSGKLTLTQLTALIREVDLMISPDSGPAHIATTQGTPVIGLYAYHNPLRTGPYRNLANVVSVYEQNAQQEYGKPSIQLPWATKLKGKNLMAQIDVQDVVVQMKALGLL